MQWHTLNRAEQIGDLLAASYETPVLIFKHSVRCGVSSFVKNRFEDDWRFSDEEIVPYYLDLIQYRDVSNLLARQLGVVHESPQILVLRDGECVFNASHLSARVDALDPFANSSVG